MLIKKYICPWEGVSGKGWGFYIFLKIFVKVYYLETKSLIKKHKNPDPGANKQRLENRMTATEIQIYKNVPLVKRF